MQIRLRDLATKAAESGTPQPDEYHRIIWHWCAFKVPAFVAVAVIFWLMITRP
jgi:uncharacterized membrane protein